MSNEDENSVQNELKVSKHSALEGRNRRSCVPNSGENTQKSTYVTNLPETKCIQVYVNGDEHFSGCRCVVNSRYYRNLDMFLNYLTERLQPSFGAVRNIYTPVNGHSVIRLEDLISKKKYVVAGNERFKKLDVGYAEMGDKRNRKGRFNPKNKFKAAKPRTVHQNTLTLFLFENGNHKNKPCKIVLLPQDQENFETVYGKISEVLKLGPIKRLCLLNGKPVRSIEELTNNHSYVIIGKHEVFKNGSYGCFRNNNSARLSLNSRQPSQKSSVTVTKSSEVYSLSSAQSLRLSQSLSSSRSHRNKSVSYSSAKRKSKNLIQSSDFIEGYHTFTSQENSMLKYNSAKTNLVNKVHLDLDADFGGMFRSKIENNQTFGAVEIEDGPDTLVDLPLDLLDAEEIEDDITPDMERSMQHLSLDVPEEIVAYLPAITSNKRNDRQISSSKYDLSHSQTLDTRNIFA